MNCACMLYVHVSWGDSISTSSSLNAGTATLFGEGFYLPDWQGYFVVQGLQYPCLYLRPCTRREQQARAQLQPLAGEISRWRSGKRAAGLWGEGRIKLWNPRLQQPNFINATCSFYFYFQAGVLSYTVCDGFVKWLSSLEIQGTHLELFQVDRFILEHPWVINVWCLHGSSARWYFAELSFALHCRWRQTTST